MARSAAIARDGLMVDGTVVGGRLGLDLPANLGLPEWCQLGVRLLGAVDSSCWWVGDWLIFGCARFPGRYQQAMAETGLDYQTLRNYAWVARAFAPSRRRDALTFQHHMEVAALSVEEQDHWLDFAVRLKWSRNELRRHVRANRDRGSLDGGPVNPAVSVQLSLTEERYARWARAAERDNTKLQDWMVDVLDRAVREARAS